MFNNSRYIFIFSDDGIRRCSASIYKDNDNSSHFTQQPKKEWRGYSKNTLSIHLIIFYLDFDDVLSGRDEKPWAGSGFRAGLFHDNALSYDVIMN